jgi:hypothetical protein
MAKLTRAVARYYLIKKSDYEGAYLIGYKFALGVIVLMATVFSVSFLYHYLTIK